MGTVKASALPPLRIMASLEQRVASLETLVQALVKQNKPSFLKGIHEMYEGAQDAFISKMPGSYRGSMPPLEFQKNLGTYVHKVATVADVKECWGGPGKTTPFKIREHVELARGDYTEMGITNFKILNKTGIRHINFVCGGQTIDRCWMRISDTFNLLTAPNSMPLLRNHGLVVEFITEPDADSVEFSYDVVSYMKAPWNKCNEPFTMWGYYGTQFTGEDLVPTKNGVATFRMPYNHPIVSLTAYLPTVVTNVSIILDGADYGLRMEPQDETLVIDDIAYRKFYFEFGDENSANFSRIERPELKVSAPLEEVRGFVYGRHKSVIQAINGMAGLMFVK